MKEKSPKLFEYLTNELKNRFGFDNGQVSTETVIKPDVKKVNMDIRDSSKNRLKVGSVVKYKDDFFVVVEIKARKRGIREM